MYAEPRLSIKEWAEDDRPREKLLLKGRHVLTDAELVAILIGSGNRDETAVDLSKRILADHDNDLDAVARLTVNDLKKYRGMGEAKAISVVAAMELGRRRTFAPGPEMPTIRVSDDAYRAIVPVLSDLQHEEFWILLCNRSNAVMRKELISKGGLNTTVVDPKIVFKAALEHSASGIVLCHNHPSGGVKPSQHDMQLTKKLMEGARIFEIALLDHIIVGAKTYFSFADDGLL